MLRMTSPKITVFAALLLMWLMSLACSRQPAVGSLDEPVPDNSQLPFERSPNRNGIPPTTAIRFLGIPAGTPVAVRLQTPISSESAHSGDSFQGFLDDPIIIQGQTVVARGSQISGRVVTARPSDRLQHPGYLRITLSTIAVADKPQPVQTNSRFVKGGTPAPNNPPQRNAIENVSRAHDPAAQATPVTDDAQVPVGERFVFRLKETLPGPMDQLPSQLPVIPALNSRTEHP
jgi:hypothetical protein